MLNNQEPGVSVIIPTHNRPEFVVRAVKSVLAQTFDNYEIIVVDDGDNPTAEKVLRQFMNLPNFVYLETGKNQGAPVARNKGIGQSRGKFVAFLDDDDIWVVDKLQKQINLFENLPEKVGFVFSAANNITKNGVQRTFVDESMRDYSEFALTRFKGFLTPSLVIRKYVIDEIGGFDEKLPASQEPDLIIRITRKYQGACINEPLVEVSMDGNYDHIGGDIKRRIVGREMLLNKHKYLYKNHRDLWATQLFRLAIMCRDARFYRRSAYLFFYSFKYKASPVKVLHIFRCLFLSLFVKDSVDYKSLLNPHIF